jgi:hypothetical protein
VSGYLITNLDHVAMVIHNYRWRLSLADGEPRYDALERQLSLMPIITVPTITVASDFDGVAADGASYRGMFSGRYLTAFCPASATTFPKRHRKTSRTQSSTPTSSDRRIGPRSLGHTDTVAAEYFSRLR